jgi:hypothetical protein
VAILAIVLTTGCGEGDWQKPPTTPSPAPAPGAATATAAPAATAPAAPQADAKAGAAAKGGGGVTIVPLATLFSIKERILFDITIPHEMNFYKVAHGGKGPATHQEFMQHFVPDQHIALLPLPPGHRYVYDPAKERLTVEKDNN